MLNQGVNAIAIAMHSNEMAVLRIGISSSGFLFMQITQIINSSCAEQDWPRLAKSYKCFFDKVLKVID